MRALHLVGADLVLFALPAHPAATIDTFKEHQYSIRLASGIPKDTSTSDVE